MADIFISYASEDRDRAARLARSFEGCGFSVWWDRELRVGSDFTQAIGEQLEGARCVVVLWSTSSIGSNWVRDEAAEGLRRRVLVPVAVDAVQPPYGFRSLQTADLSGWSGDGSAPAFQRLVADLRLRLAGPPVGVAATASAPGPAAAAVPSAAWRYVVPVAALFAAAIVAVVVLRPPGGAPPADIDRTSAAASAAEAARIAEAASAAEAARVAEAASAAEAARAAEVASAAEAARVAEAASAAAAEAATSVADAERAADQSRRDEQRRADAARRAAQRAADEKEREAAAAREQAIGLASDRLDFGTSAFGSSVNPRRVLIKNGSGAAVEFTVTSRGTDDRAFVLRDTNCPKSARGWRLDDGCWIAWSFTPPRPGSFSKRIGFEVDGHPVSRELLLAGTAVDRDAPAAANTITIAGSHCRRTDAKTFTIDVNGQVEAEVGAFMVVTARIADDRTTLGCRGWGAAEPDDDAKLQGACKRRARDPQRTMWKAQIVLRSPRPPPEAYALVLAAGADGRTRVLARDSAALDCG